MTAEHEQTENSLSEVIKSINKGDYPKDIRHLVHRCLKIKNLELIVDKKQTSGGDFAIEGEELARLGIQRVMIQLESDTLPWDENPISSYALRLESNGSEIVKAIMQEFQARITDHANSEHYGVSQSAVVALIESPTNESGLLIVFPRTKQAVEYFINSAGYVPEAICTWLMACVPVPIPEFT